MLRAGAADPAARWILKHPSLNRGQGVSMLDSLDELDALVAPVIAHIQTVVSGLRRSIPQRRALVGVLRGLWDHLGGEALKFVEEDLR